MAIERVWPSTDFGGWSIGVRPLYHALTLALGGVWLATFAWALFGLARQVRKAARAVALLGNLMAVVGTAAGIGVVGYHLYLLAVIGPQFRSSDTTDSISAFLHYLDVRETYLWVGATAGVALLAALSLLAFGAARAGICPKWAGYAVALLPVPAFFLSSIGWAHVAALAWFAVALARS